MSYPSESTYVDNVLHPDEIDYSDDLYDHYLDCDGKLECSDDEFEYDDIDNMDDEDYDDYDFDDYVF